MRLRIGNARTSQAGLRVRDVEVGGNAAAIRAHCRAVRVLRGKQKRGSRLALSQSELEIVIGLDDVAHDLVAGEIELLFRDPALRLCDANPVAAQAAVVQRHLDRDHAAVSWLIEAGPPRNALHGHTADVLADVAADRYTRIELRLRPADFGLPRSNRSYACEQVRALRER